MKESKIDTIEYYINYHSSIIKELCKYNLTKNQYKNLNQGQAYESP